MTSPINFYRLAFTKNTRFQGASPLASDCPPDEVQTLGSQRNNRHGLTIRAAGTPSKRTALYSFRDGTEVV